MFISDPISRLHIEAQEDVHNMICLFYSISIQCTTITYLNIWYIHYTKYDSKQTSTNAQELNPMQMKYTEYISYCTDQFTKQISKSNHYRDYINHSI